MTDVSQIDIRNKYMYNNNIQRKMSTNNKRNGEGEYSTLSGRNKRVIDRYINNAIRDNVFVSVKFLMHLLHSYNSSRVCIYFKLFK